jgi:hypothetical protein
MRLYDLAHIVRSKNAGPFMVTIDLQFGRDEDYHKVLASPAFTAERIAALYGLDAGEVAIRPFARIRTIKVSMPRRVSSGAPGDRDVYGSQQHFPLADLVL